MKFIDLQAQIREHQAAIQEIQSTCYVVFPVDAQFRFISFMDLDTLEMGYAIVDNNMNSIEILSNIPKEVLIGFAKFIEMIDRWQKNSDLEFPFDDYIGNIEEFLHFNDDIIPTQHDPGVFEDLMPDCVKHNCGHSIDGHEGELK